MNAPIDYKPGDKVVTQKNPEGMKPHHGVIEAVDYRRKEKPYRVRWHKGFASWQGPFDIQLEN